MLAIHFFRTVEHLVNVKNSPLKWAQSFKVLLFQAETCEIQTCQKRELEFGSVMPGDPFLLLGCDWCAFRSNVCDV